MVPVLITMVIFIQWRIGQMKIESNRKKDAVKPTQLEVPPTHTAGPHTRASIYGHGRCVYLS